MDTKETSSKQSEAKPSDAQQTQSLFARFLAAIGLKKSKPKDDPNIYPLY